jgi:CCR4-NOT transcription complex subunit 1
MPVSLVKFYEGSLRVISIIRHDYPEFLCDFHFNFVNSLPEHCIQLKNIILSSQPRSIPMYNPFSKNLKVDTITDIQKSPRMQSNFDNYLTFQNLREDLEKYFRTKTASLIQVICDKMMQSEEVINGRRKINSNIINAVALFIGNFALQ